MAAELSDELRELLNAARNELSQGELLAARVILLNAYPALARARNRGLQANVLTMLGLLEEFTGYRAEAGVHYCCAMRLAYKTNQTEMGDMLSRRLSRMAGSSQDTVFHRPAASQDDSRRNTKALAAALGGRFEVLLGEKMSGLESLIAAINDAPAEGGVLAWFAEDLRGLVAGLDSQQRARLQKVSTQPLLIEALKANSA